MSALPSGLTNCCADLVPVIQLTRYCQVAPFVVLLYDYLLTLDQEVEHIWKRGLTPTTIVYYIIRYGGSAFSLFTSIAFVTPLSPEVSRIFLLTQPWPACLIMWLVQYVLQTRLYVLYDRSKTILAIMGIAFVAEIAVLTTILTINDVDLRTVTEPIPGVFFCISTDVPRLLLQFWWAPLIFETILCGLAIYIGVMHARQGYRIKPMGGVSLVDALVRGNVTYFIIVLVTCLSNAIMWQIGYQWMQLPDGFAQAIEIITGCRLILHLRNLASGQSDGSSLSQPLFRIPRPTFVSDGDADVDS